jgi:hypothetical protein
VFQPCPSVGLTEAAMPIRLERRNDGIDRRAAAS